jgi:pimeloyl-ACP methyl ester carboxylesterase
VRGRRLLMHRSGDGGPSIVFLPGAGTVGLDYLNIQQLGAQLATSILYDRAGTGWSERVAMPRTAAQVTDELRDLLNAAGAPAPYLLVGHSLGGLYARHYAQRFPGEVAGLLLLDPAHEDYNAYMPPRLDKAGRAPADKRPSPVLVFLTGRLGRFALQVLAGAVRNRFTRGFLEGQPTVKRYRDLYRDLFAQEMADWPPPMRDILVERHVSLDWLLVGIEEASNVEQLYGEVRRAGPLPDIPLIVLNSTETDTFRRIVAPNETDERRLQEIDGKRRLYEALAASVPRGEVRPVDAGHLTIHYRHPEAVLQALRDLLD